MGIGAISSICSTLPPCSRGGPIEAQPVGRGLWCVGGLPPCSRGGPIEAGGRLGIAHDGTDAFRRVHAAAPLKLELRQDGVVSAGRQSLPPCSRGGPIEAATRPAPGHRQRTSFRRVHAAAPLKQWW